MSEWTTDLRKAKPGWLVEQDCVGVDPAGGTYDVVKGGHVVECREHSLLVSLATPLGEDELWQFGYDGLGMKLRVRPPDAAE